MTAEEIRTCQEGRTDNDFAAGALCTFLREIAAQLAELNQTLRDIHPELKLPPKCRDHQCDYYTAYLAHGGPDMSHEGYHAQCKYFEGHLEMCSKRDSVEICRTCTRFEKELRA